MSGDITESHNTGWERRLAAILHADVVGYSRLTAQDEEQACRALSESRDLIKGCVERHNGRIVDYAGDELLAEFRSVRDALAGAVGIQSELAKRNSSADQSCRMQFRIGVNLGEIVVDGDNIYGDGINVAARIQELANPGGICVSEHVYIVVGNRLPFEYVYLGKKKVKNMDEPIGVYRLTDEAFAQPVNADNAVRSLQDPASDELSQYPNYYSRPSQWYCIFCGVGPMPDYNDYICTGCNNSRPFIGGSATMRGCPECRQMNLLIASYCEWCGADMEQGLFSADFPADKQANTLRCAERPATASNFERWLCPFCGGVANLPTESEHRILCASKTCTCGAVGLAAPAADTDEIIDDALGIFAVEVQEKSRGYDALIHEDLRRAGIELQEGESARLDEGAWGEYRSLWFRRSTQPGFN